MFAICMRLEIVQSDVVILFSIYPYHPLQQRYSHIETSIGVSADPSPYAVSPQVT